MMPDKYASKLLNKRVLVLGGTSGIGFCVAEAALEAGALVTVSSSTQSKIDKTITRLQTSYPDHRASNISGHPCNLSGETCEAQLTALLDHVTQHKAHKLDHIVHTAGDMGRGFPKIATVTLPEVLQTMDVRYFSSIFLAKLAPAYMTVSIRSSITFTSGVNTAKPGAGWSVVAGSGAAREGLTRGLAVDLKPIRVNNVSPGAILTELFDNFTGGDPEKLEGFKKMWGSKTLGGEIGSPEDTAEAYLYCMKDGFLTGQTILTDGGYTLV